MAGAGMLRPREAEAVRRSGAALTKERTWKESLGNILYTDEGLGVRAMELARERWDFPENVTLLD